MAMSYATVSDVATQMQRALTTEEQALVTAMLPVVDLLIDQAVPSVADRIVSGDLAAAVVAFVAASVVARALRTPEGVTETEVALDDFRSRQRRESPAEGLALTASEVALLSPTEQDVDASAFSIQPGGALPYVTFPAPVGSPWL
jgi:hypothetical protein